LATSFGLVESVLDGTLADIRKVPLDGRPLHRRTPRDPGFRSGLAKKPRQNEVAQLGE
jgi:hypothetical protein